MGTRAVTRSPTRNLGDQGVDDMAPAQKNTTRNRHMKVYMGSEIHHRVYSDISRSPNPQVGTCSFQVSLVGQLLMASTSQRRCQPGSASWTFGGDSHHMTKMLAENLYTHENYITAFAPESTPKLKVGGFSSTKKKNTNFWGCQPSVDSGLSRFCCKRFQYC